MPEKVTISYQYENGYRNVYRNCQRRLSTLTNMKSFIENAREDYQLLPICNIQHPTFQKLLFKENV